jgi:6,7-dimethyl-8-ribityllumazine synthase
MHAAPIQGKHDVGDLRIAIVAARFNEAVVENLIKGALETLERQGAGKGQVDLVRVPGAFEIPAAARKLAELRRHDAIVALGAVIRGDTAHFEYVAGECARGLGRIASDTGIPIAFGVLTTNTEEQAIERADPSAGNKGGEAALTAIEMANLLRRLED